MIVKFHPRGRGGGAGPVDYLLGKDRQREGASVLQGKPEEVRELIDASPYVTKYTSGGLSFAEADLPPGQREKLMANEDTKDFIDNPRFYTKDNVFFLEESDRWNYIKDNSKSNKGIDKFEKKAKELKNKYEDLKIKRDKLIDTKRLNLAKSYRMKTFLKSIEKSDDQLKYWNDSIWMLMVESATVYRDKRIKFKFYNGIVEK